MKYRPVTVRALALARGCSIVGGWIGYRVWLFHTEDKLRVGVSALKTGGDYSVAREKLLPLAKEGNQHAQRLAAYVYAFGAGGPVDDVQAEMWARRGECDCPIRGEIEYDIALDYLDGILDRQAAPSQASAWLRRAAEAGNPEAQRLLASPERLSAKGFQVDPHLVGYWPQVLAADAQ